MPDIAYLSLGSNLGDRLRNLTKAVRALDRLPDTQVTGISRVYETEPVGVAGQPDFLNAVVCVETGLSALLLLRECQRIETALLRERPFAHAPRTVDIDILLYNDLQLNDPELTLPHPRMNERNFVLVPLCELTGNPASPHPAKGIVRLFDGQIVL